MTRFNIRQSIWAENKLSKSTCCVVTRSWLKVRYRAKWNFTLFGYSLHNRGFLFWLALVSLQNLQNEDELSDVVQNYFVMHFLNVHRHFRFNHRVCFHDIFFISSSKIKKNVLILFLLHLNLRIQLLSIKLKVNIEQRSFLKNMEGINIFCFQFLYLKHP